MILVERPSASVIQNSSLRSITAWWFGCHEFYFPRNIGNNMEESSQLTHIFQRGGPTTNQIKNRHVIKWQKWIRTQETVGRVFHQKKSAVPGVQLIDDGELGGFHRGDHSDLGWSCIEFSHEWAIPLPMLCVLFPNLMFTSFWSVVLIWACY